MLASNLFCYGMCFSRKTLVGEMSPEEYFYIPQMLDSTSLVMERYEVPYMCYTVYPCFRVRVMVFNGTFNNISVMSW
jgi:hypothetical protein